MKPRAYFNVSPWRLHEALHVPADAEVIGAEWDWARSCVRVFVESDQFPPCEEGVPLQSRSVSITEHTRPAEPTDVIHRYTSKWGGQ